MYQALVEAGSMANEASETTNFQPAQLVKALEIVKKNAKPVGLLQKWPLLRAGRRRPRAFQESVF
jgi:hypothetical protein